MTNKQIAKAFLTEIVEGRIEEAFEKYAEMSGKHHNAFTAAGLENLKESMIQNDKQFPNKQFEILNMAEDGDLVMVQLKLSLSSDMPAMAVVHILKFRNGKIIEMWDLAQPEPKDNPNADGMF